MNSNLPIRLQRQLAIPVFAISDVETGLWASYSEHAGRPLFYVHSMIEDSGLTADWYSGVLSTHIHYSSGYPCQISVQVPPDISPATHLVATTGAINGRVVLIHHLVLAPNCIRLPYFPVSEALNSMNPTHIPIVMLPLPSPDTFHIFREYLYLKDEENLRMNIYHTYPGEHEIEALSRSLDKIMGVYLNACELGFMGIDGFYEFLNELWVDAIDRLVQYPGYIYA